MGIVERIAQLLLANINGLLDRAEDPEKMLHQFLREMESHRRHAREAIVEMIAQEKLFQADWTQHSASSAQWSTRAEAAVVTGRDDLALVALRRKGSELALASLYEAQLTEQRRAVAQMKVQLRALDTKYRQTVSQRDLLVARHRRARAQETLARTASVFALPDIDGGVERFERTIRVSEARAAALSDIAFDSLDDRIAHLEDDLDLEQELAALKELTGSRRALGERSQFS